MSRANRVLLRKIAFATFTRAKARMSPLRYAVIVIGALAFNAAVWSGLYAQVQNPGAQIGGGAVTFGHCVSMGPGLGQVQDAGSVCNNFTPAAATKLDDTNVTLTLTGTPATALMQAVQFQMGWTGTLAAARLNSSVVQAITNDTNITGGIAAQTLTFGWAGTLAAARLNSNVVQGFGASDVTGSILNQVATLTLGAFTGDVTKPSGSLVTTLGAFTGDVTKSAGSLATTVSKFSGNVLPVGAGADSQLLIGNGASNLIFATIPNCPSGIIQYTAATHLFNCAAAGTGTVTSAQVAAGSGIAVSGTCTITTTGVCTVTQALPYFNANRSANQTVTTAILTKVQFDTKNLDSNSWYDNVTNFRYTPLLAGKYLVHVSVDCGGTTVTFCNAVVYKNGSPFAQERTATATGVAASGATSSVIVSMNGTTDFLEGWALNSCTGTCTISGGTGPILSWFEAQYISP